MGHDAINDIVSLHVLSPKWVFGNSVINTVTLGTRSVENKPPFARLVFLRDYSKATDVKVR